MSEAGRRFAVVTVVVCAACAALALAWQAVYAVSARFPVAGFVLRCAGGALAALAIWLAGWMGGAKYAEDRTVKRCGLDCKRLLEAEWWVVSTSLNDGFLLLDDQKGGLSGVVRNPTSDEWKRAFDAPRHPYRWFDLGRVTLLEDFYHG